MVQKLKQFLFFTKEGFTYEPSGIESQNLQILGDAEGLNLLDAFKKFKQHQPYLKSSLYKEVIAIETVGEVIYNLEL
jgi:hypothetical protein